MDKLLQSMTVGVQRRWRSGVAAGFAVLGGVWLLTEVITRVSHDASTWLDHHGEPYLIAAGAAALIGFFVCSYEARKLSFTLPNTGTTITLRFSNIFDEAGADWLVGVNEFFDSTLGDIVAATSLHGQIIASIYNGNESAFRRDVDASLSAYESTQVVRSTGQSARYPLGTTAVIPRAGHKIYLLAITKTDTETARSSSTIPILWESLTEAIRVIDQVGNGAPLAMPLIGNGRASLNIPPQHLLRLLILKLSAASRSYDLPRSITISLSNDCFEHLDLVEICNGWSTL